MKSMIIIDIQNTFLLLTWQFFTVQFKESKNFSGQSGELQSQMLATQEELWNRLQKVFVLPKLSDQEGHFISLLQKHPL